MPSAILGHFSASLRLAGGGSRLRVAAAKLAEQAQEVAEMEGPRAAGVQKLVARVFAVAKVFGVANDLGGEGLEVVGKNLVQDGDGLAAGGGELRVRLSPFGVEVVGTGGGRRGLRQVHGECFAARGSAAAAGPPVVVEGLFARPVDLNCSCLSFFELVGLYSRHGSIHVAAEIVLVLPADLHRAAPSANEPSPVDVMPPFA